MPGILNASYMLSFNPHNNPWGRCYYYAHFKAEKTEAQPQVTQLVSGRENDSNLGRLAPEMIVITNNNTFLMSLNKSSLSASHSCASVPSQELTSKSYSSLISVGLCYSMAFVWIISPLWAFISSFLQSETLLL